MLEGQLLVLYVLLVACFRFSGINVNCGYVVRQDSCHVGVCFERLSVSPITPIMDLLKEMSQAKAIMLLLY